MMGDRELLSKALVVECVRPNGLPMVGDLKKMHGGCYIIVMDYHFLQANASLFVGTIGHWVCCWWNASALQPTAIQLKVSISKSLQLWGKPKIMRKITGTQLPISVSCPRQAHRQRRPCYLYAFAGAGDLQPGWRPMDRHGLGVYMIYMEECQLLRHKDGSVQDCSLTRWICCTC